MACYPFVESSQCDGAARASNKRRKARTLRHAARNETRDAAREWTAEARRAVTFAAPRTIDAIREGR